MLQRRNIWRCVIALALVCLGTGTSLAQYTVSGTVVDPFSAPVDSVEIRLFTDTGFPIGIPLTYTGIAGDYSIAGLPTGGYLLEFRPLTADKLVAMELPADVQGANTVRDANLATGFLLHGFVRDLNGVGVPGIDLQVWDRDTGDKMLTPGDDTNAIGYYDVIVPLGDYDLEWRAVAAGSLPYIPVIGQALVETDVQVDVVMVVGWTVSGIVRDNLGAPLFNINLDFIDVNTGVKLDVPGDNTLVDGSYAASLPVGIYDVIAKPVASTRLLTGLKSLVVISGDTTGVDFDLQTGFLMSGTVTGNGGVVSSVDLDVVDAATGLDVTLAFDTTDPAGLYQIVVPAGQMHVTFSPPGGSVLAAKLVPSVVVAGDLVLNADLVDGVLISGTVNAAGLPVVGTDIDLKDPISGLSIPLHGDHTDEAGFFQTLVAPGSYILEVEPPKLTGLVAQRYPNFAVAADTVVAFVVVPGARVTGTVTATGGGVLADVSLDVLRTADGVEVFTPGSRTDTLGQYEVVVPADNYTFNFAKGASYVVPDSLELTGVNILGDTVVDAVFNSVASAVNDELPPVANFGVQAYPNPFNPKTTISFNQKIAGRTRVAIHQVDGSLVAVLADGEFAVGSHSLVWHGLDSRGQRVSSGVYMVAVANAQGRQATKIALVK